MKTLKIGVAEGILKQTVTNFDIFPTVSVLEKIQQYLLQGNKCLFCITMFRKEYCQV